MERNPKAVGYLLIGFSIALLAALSFIKIQLDGQASYLCAYFHEKSLETDCPVHKANSVWTAISWALTTAFGIDFLVFVLGVYIAFFYKPFPMEHKKDFKQIDFSRLDDEERKVYELVKSKNGSAYQTDLIKETSFSKVKVTRVLDRLEAKDILERKRRGMTNIIVLK
ncbi:hypothetical protein HYT53_00075 [Candidatus Woesearchaeota archaeon]|nr:hypothetical protein [Candidatus Woesearchaeota archaeon]